MLLILDSTSFILLAEIFLQKNTQCAYASKPKKVGVHMLHDLPDTSREGKRWLEK